MKKLLILAAFLPLGILLADKATAQTMANEGTCTILCGTGSVTGPCSSINSIPCDFVTVTPKQNPPPPPPTTTPTTPPPTNTANPCAANPCSCNPQACSGSGGSGSGSGSGSPSTGLSPLQISDMGYEMDPATRQNIQNMIAAIKTLIGKTYINGRNGPDAYDCSSTVLFGLRKVKSTIGDYNADQLMRNFTKATGTATPGTLIFYDWTNDGRIDHVTTIIEGGIMIQPSSSATKIIEMKTTGLDSYLAGQGGVKYYRKVDWQKVK